MNFNNVLGLICLVILTALASPVPIASEESIVVQRQIFEDINDEQLKQIPLSTFLGDIESNIFKSALSFNKVLTDKNVSESELKVKDDSENDVHKRQSLTKEEKFGETSAATTTESSVTLEQIPQTNSIPTHTVMDRITIQPHIGGLALIPIFERKATRKDEVTNDDHEITKITLSKTKIATLPMASPESSTSSSTTNSATSGSTSATSATTTTEAVLNTSTTPKNIEQLKEAEEDLKEKLAEIEAEPVILSARV